MRSRAPRVAKPKVAAVEQVFDDRPRNAPTSEDGEQPIRKKKAKAKPSSYHKKAKKSGKSEAKTKDKEKKKSKKKKKDNAKNRQD